jgi:outer membrane protein
MSTAWAAPTLLLYQSQYNYLVSQLRLKAAVGALGEEDLSKVNQSLR